MGGEERLGAGRWARFVESNGGYRVRRATVMAQEIKDM